MGKTAMATINGQPHKFQRALGGRAFTDEALSSYMSSIEKFTEEHLQRCVALSAGGAFNPAVEVKRYTYAVAECVALGSDLKSDRAMDWFTTWLQGFEALTSLNLPFTAFGRAMRARKNLLADFKLLLDEKRRLRQQGAEESDSPGILSNVLRAELDGTSLTDEEILDFMIGVMFAGHDTTLAMIQSMMYYMGQHPELKSELQAEVASLWDGKTPLTYAMCISSAPKCLHFLEESLRAFPPVSVLIREIPEEFTYKGYRFPKGWKVAASVEYEHMSMGGDGFDMAVDHKSLPMNKNLTFGLGLRHCIGYKLAKLELSVWLLHLLANYELDVHETSVSRFPFNHGRVSISMRPKA